ncbi:phage integrase SAM-like domain-containing protein [Chryseobacterium wangxinyae]|uniref:phage integrase SAM-like domain-containing protein n=1 Tax=Chryseobacterium sp. CY353 TaxID=2997334 RepID=UPI00226FF2EF|nr:phage integrase SAM-like domain-containing protein [Chryseobacterium sp. CY353]MCY0970538.1 phage integrase SAM-like domain-containing protein [Chryseobacterium sp. CY353]
MKNRFLGIDVRKITLIEVFKDHNNQIKELIGKGFAHGTWERYETSLKHTQQFMKWKYNISDIDVTEINPAFIADYEKTNT